MEIKIIYEIPTTHSVIHNYILFCYCLLSLCKCVRGVFQYIFMRQIFCSSFVSILDDLLSTIKHIKKFQAEGLQ